MLGLLVDYGLTDRVCRMFDVTAEHLEQLALLEMETRRLAGAKAERENNG